MKKFSCLLLSLSLALLVHAQKTDTSYSENWSGNTWAIVGRTILTHNNNCQLETSLYQSLDQATNNWINRHVYVYTYEPLRKTTETRYWIPELNAFKAVRRSTYQLNEFEKDAKVWFENFEQGIWDTLTVSVYEYDINQQLIKSTVTASVSSGQSHSYTLYHRNDSLAENGYSSFVYDTTTQQFVATTRGNFKKDTVNNSDEFKNNERRISEGLIKFYEVV